MQTDILLYLPEVFRDIREMKAHAVAQRPELEREWAAVEELYNDQFLYLMGESGVAQWEKMLNISHKETDTLEDRRFRIINRFNAQLPYTYKMLEYHLTQMCGADGYSMSYNASAWTLIIKIALTSKEQFDEVLKLVEQMIPANLILDYDLMYNKYEMLSKYTYAQLAAYTYGALRNEVLS